MNLLTDFAKSAAAATLVHAIFDCNDKKGGQESSYGSEVFSPKTFLSADWRYRFASTAAGALPSGIDLKEPSIVTVVSPERERLSMGQIRSVRRQSSTCSIVSHEGKYHFIATNAQHSEMVRYELKAYSEESSLHVLINGESILVFVLNKDGSVNRQDSGLVTYSSCPGDPREVGVLADYPKFDMVPFVFTGATSDPIFMIGNLDAFLWFQPASKKQVLITKNDSRQSIDDEAFIFAASAIADGSALLGGAITANDVNNIALFVGDNYCFLNGANAVKVGSNNFVKDEPIYGFLTLTRSARENCAVQWNKTHFVSFSFTHGEGGLELGNFVHHGNVPVAIMTEGSEPMVMLADGSIGIPSEDGGESAGFEVQIQPDANVTKIINAADLFEPKPVGSDALLTVVSEGKEHLLLAKKGLSEKGIGEYRPALDSTVDAMILQHGIVFNGKFISMLGDEAYQEFGGRNN